MIKNSAPWTVAVLGPGGIGGLAAALLARAGHRVICLAREETAAALNEQGLTLRSGKFGDFTVPVEADTRLRESVDAVIVAPKETALRAALDRVPPHVVGDALLMPLLNGVEHPAVLRERYPAQQVVPGTIRAESTRTAPGVIEHATPFARVEVASDTAPHARVEALAYVLDAAGFATTLCHSERSMLWGKLSMLLPLALLTTRYEVPIGGVRDAHRSELLAVLEEFKQVADGIGAEVDTDAVLAFLDEAPEGMRSSMQRDAAAGRPLEVDAIGGALLREAARQGVDVPVTAKLVAALGG
ncbi:ketopantoate reductase family protein [Streptomyces apocyni]|uniref:ketopantoate reductase family protein n=1 Tax=Streptomyces apocyni TaxID=2654677 RepID=UPI0012EAD064|nr:2-dehydropantoate 2-reductase [Streptomyces apocyni]